MAALDAVKDVSYLVCTLGRAAILNRNEPHGIDTINQMIEEGAKTFDGPVIAMPEPDTQHPENEWDVTFLSKTLLQLPPLIPLIAFQQILDGSTSVAFHLESEGIRHREISQEGTQKESVGMLCTSDLDFIMTWFGLIRMGVSVILIAPQCSAAAVAQLCKSENATQLIVHPNYLDKATEAQNMLRETGRTLTLTCTPNRSVWTQKSSKTFPQTYSNVDEERDSVAFFYHTSGTTTGMPKTIPQLHRSCTTAFPKILGGTPTLTMTPLYHGGGADLLRSLMSHSLLYIFPSSVPITADNMLRVFDAARRQNKPVKNFSSVPYVIKMLSEDERGLRELISMELVGFGGAPFPKEIGDQLTREGVKLVSRYGSAECGFLLNSYRNFEEDEEWLWVRSDVGCENLVFEDIKTQEGVAELVVGNKWTVLGKTNRPDGSFATGDLFKRHATKPNTWLYIGRNDDMIVMENGKKVEPTPMETSICASKYITDAIVFGENRPYTGLLLFPSSPDMKKEEVLEKVWPTIVRTNEISPSQSVISRGMVVVMPHGTIFPKSAKGSIQRPAAYKQFEQVIEKAYVDYEQGHSSTEKKNIPTQTDMLEYIHHKVKEATGLKDLKDDDDLFNLGVNSIQAAAIRNSIQTEIELKQKLRNNVVYEYPSVEKLSTHVWCKLTGGREEERDDNVKMIDMLDRHGNFEKISGEKLQRNHNRVLLTGATGGLGAHLLTQLMRDEKNTIIYCLCRASDDDEARRRVEASIMRRKLARILDADRVVCLSADLSADRFGLCDEAYGELKSCNLIIHAAWAVNFVGSLESFERQHVAGLQRLLHLSLTSTRSPSSFYFCSSGASVMNNRDDVIAEELPSTTSQAVPMGYARSKWVGEKLCERANSAGGDVHILRIGQLCGDTDNGVWNETEGWPLLFASSNHTRSLPSLEEEICWLPVDTAAKAVLEIVDYDNARGGSSDVVYHVMNPHDDTPFSSVLTFFRENGGKIQILPPLDWLERVEESEEDTVKNPSRKLLPLWRNIYSKETKTVKFDTRKAREASESLRQCPPIDEKICNKFFSSWRSTGFLHSVSQ
ncbi:NRPS-like enzyme [Planoprotostelium fungivorum]|uniref:NRPS-like enzyme n=1 Tax=Planoprotostelium fungivorum TaxID=1890364 RepID=A0A2P6N5J2_9EUKA|nr:NRPS-like enzyme [Planoprotostelium fungivorum]